MAEMNVRDIERDIINTVVLCNGLPVLAKSISPNGRAITVRSVGGGEEEVVAFSLKTITPINGRVGMVNGYTGGVYYVSRLPHRKMAIGFNWNNSNIHVVYDKDRNDYFHVKEFNHRGLEDAIRGRYPSFRQAIKFAKSVAGACAFDKQFAVTHEGVVYYKDQGAVGKLRDGAKTVDDIIWSRHREHLQIILDNDYEKTVRTFRN